MAPEARSSSSVRSKTSSLSYRPTAAACALFIVFLLDLRVSTAYHRPTVRHILSPSSSSSSTAAALRRRRQRGVVRCNLQVDDDELLLRKIPPLTVAVFGEDGVVSDGASDADGENARPQPVFARFVSWLLRRFVAEKTQYVSGLEVHVLTPSNTKLIRGKIDALELKFDKMIFAQLFVSGGGRIILKDVDLRMRRFLFQNLQSVRKPYTIYGDFLLTQSDVVNSKLIRNLMQLLVNTVLERAVASYEAFSAPLPPLVSAPGAGGGGAANAVTQDVLKVVVKKVSIRARRLFASGEVSVSAEVPGNIVSSTAGGAMMPFEVSTGAGVRDGGQVLYLKDIQVVLNPDSAFRATVPIPLATPIDVDLGEDFRLSSLVIADKHVWLRADAVISPIPPFQVAPVTSRALYRYDLAALLSSLLKLQGGIIVPWRGQGNNNENNENEEATAAAAAAAAENAVEEEEAPVYSQTPEGRESVRHLADHEDVPAPFFAPRVGPWLQRGLGEGIVPLPVVAPLIGVEGGGGGAGAGEGEVGEGMYERPGPGDFAANWDWLDTEG